MLARRGGGLPIRHALVNELEILLPEVADDLARVSTQLRLLCLARRCWYLSAREAAHGDDHVDAVAGLAGYVESDDRLAVCAG